MRTELHSLVELVAGCCMGLLLKSHVILLYVLSFPHPNFFSKVELIGMLIFKKNLLDLYDAIIITYKFLCHIFVLYIHTYSYLCMRE